MNFKKSFKEDLKNFKTGSAIYSPDTAKTVENLKIFFENLSDEERVSFCNACFLGIDQTFRFLATSNKELFMEIISNPVIRLATQLTRYAGENDLEGYRKLMQDVYGHAKKILEKSNQTI